MRVVILICLWLAASPVNNRPGRGSSEIPEVPVQGHAAVMAADKGRAWSISEYRVVRTTEPPRVTTDVELISAGGQVLGRFRKAQETLVDHVNLEWQGRQLSIVTDRAAGTFEVTHNRVPLGMATFRRDRQEIPPAIAALLQTNADLWRLSEAIEHDVVERR